MILVNFVLGGFWMTWYCYVFLSDSALTDVNVIGLCVCESWLFLVADLSIVVDLFNTE